MEYKIECKKCKKAVTADKSIIVFEKEYLDKFRQSIYLTYFDCPSCKERHYVQIDNGSSLNIKRTALGDFRKLSKLRTSGQEISKKSVNKFNKSRNKLISDRNKLMKQYSGETVTDTETGEKVVLSFTVV